MRFPTQTNGPTDKGAEKASDRVAPPRQKTFTKIFVIKHSHGNMG